MTHYEVVQIESRVPGMNIVSRAATLMDVEELLSRIAAHAPTDGSYHKTDVEVHEENGRLVGKQVYEVSRGKWCLH